MKRKVSSMSAEEVTVSRTESMMAVDKSRGEEGRE